MNWKLYMNNLNSIKVLYLPTGRYLKFINRAININMFTEENIINTFVLPEKDRFNILKISPNKLNTLKSKQKIFAYLFGSYSYKKDSQNVDTYFSILTNGQSFFKKANNILSDEILFSEVEIIYE